MKDSVKKILLLGGVALFIVVIYLINGLTTPADYREKYEGYDLSADAEGATREGTYTRYLAAHTDANYPQKNVEVSLFDYTKGEGVAKNTEYDMEALYTDAESFVTWEIDIPESGFYNI